MEVNKCPPVPLQTRSFTAKLRECWWWEQNERKLVLEKLGNSPLVPIFVSMAVCGLVPIRLKRPFVPGGGWLSSTKLYCIAVMLLVLFITVRLLRSLFPLILQEKVGIKFHTRLQTSNAVIALIPICFVPLLWLESCVFFDKAYKCCQYELRHVEITSMELQWRGLYRHNVKMVLLFQVLVPVLLLTGLIFQLHWRVFLPYALSIVFQVHISLWFTTWIYQIRIAAESLLLFLQKGSEDRCSLALTARLKGARRLWVQLREMLEGQAIIRAIVALMHVFLYLVVVLSLYQSLHSGYQGNIRGAATQAAVCFSVFFQIYILSNESHRCTSLLNDSFIASLDRISLKVSDCETRRAVNLFFFSIIAKPSQVSLGGFTLCGRPFISTVVSAMVTLLVVLVQLQTVDKGNSAGGVAHPGNSSRV